MLPILTSFFLMLGRKTVAVMSRLANHHLFSRENEEIERRRLIPNETGSSKTHKFVSGHFQFYKFGYNQFNFNLIANFKSNESGNDSLRSFVSI